MENNKPSPAEDLQRAESRRLRKEAQRILRQALDLERRGRPAVGICCPNCGCCDLEVIDSRPAPGGLRRRRRVCRYCGKVIRTVEITA